MPTPRIPESAIRAHISGIDELEFIDGGGQGDVWRLRRNGGSDEALKVVVGAPLLRVQRETEAMQAISDRHVMRFTEAGDLTHGGQQFPFIIGEYIPGQTVAKRLDANDWPTETQALSTAVGALRGLSAIHALERVHRDIKPGNVALRNDDWDEPVILDLGLVDDMVGTSITVYPDLLGTLPFTAPDQLRREPSVTPTAKTSERRMHRSDSQVILGELLEPRQQLLHHCDPVVLGPDRIYRLPQRRVRAALSRSSP
jgi:serine/threonine protein kinase